MEIPRSTHGPAIPTIRFAEVARRLGAAAHAHGLAVPAFRCPPRTAGVARTIRRYPGGTVVSVRLRDREFAAVVDDMVEGVLVANQLTPTDAERLRPALLAAADDTVATSAAGGPAAPHPVGAQPEARAA